MKKEIRLLIEGFFDDDTFNPNNINQDIQDIGDQYYVYQVGDIYYKKKKPYAVCCGDKSQFNDKTSRFCLLNINPNDKQLKWSKTMVTRPFLGTYESQDKETHTVLQHIDENGYKNTQTVLHNFSLSEFPAFKYCIRLGDGVYLPAIDELRIFYKNKIRDIIFKNIMFNIPYVWSSTQGYGGIAFVFAFYNSDIRADIQNGAKTDLYSIIPFVKID